jgi:hypothetical protein
MPEVVIVSVMAVTFAGMVISERRDAGYIQVKTKTASIAERKL